jgi:uncharacterized protein YdcH (DUF465 family)
MNIDICEFEHDFPEHINLIRRLKVEDKNFSRLYHRYGWVSTELCRIQEEDVVVAKVLFDMMKRSRVELKNELSAILRAQTAIVQ